MNLTDEQTRFLQILSDGKKKTPMAPTFTNNLARPLLKMKLVKRAGGGYKITDAGRAALKGT